MIYTVTWNPSLDYTLTIPDWKIGHVNRTTKESMYPGGKGINVSVMLTHLGVDNTALGFVAGFVGEQIEHLLEKQGIRNELIYLPEGNSRINVKLMRQDTDINAIGPLIAKEEQLRFMQFVEKRVKPGDSIVLAGSIPAGMKTSIYEDIMKKVPYNTEVIVDTTGDTLKKCFSHHPFLIKPNQYELGDLFHVDITSYEKAINYTRKVRAYGVKNVLVSMGEAGAVLVDEENVAWIGYAPKGCVVNTVGAGDSMLAGFLAGWEKTKSYQKAFQMGLAAGSASAFSESLAEEVDVLELMKEEIVVERI